MIVFQAQVTRVTTHVTDFSAGEADEPRRDISRHVCHPEAKCMRNQLVSGRFWVMGPGSSWPGRSVADWRVLRSYGFCKSYPATLEKIAYDTCLSGFPYPEEFSCAPVEKSHLWFDSRRVVVKGVERHGVHVLPAHVNPKSDVRRLRVLARERVADQEQRGLFRDLPDFRCGNSLPYRTIEKPIVADPPTAEKALRAGC